MNIKKIILAVMLVSSIAIGTMGCSNNNDIGNSKNDNIENKDTSEVTPEDEKKNADDDKTISDSSNNTDKLEEDNTSGSDDNITKEIKNYIINGQENKSEAEKIKWSEIFLDRVDMESLYKEYLTNGGSSKDLESFANYITHNASIPSDWKDLFEKDLFDKYSEKVVRLEPLGDDLYQAYVVIDDAEKPYVVVSSRTGYFHG